MKLGFVFPGQGSQTLGMSSELAAHFACVQATYKEASKALAYDLWQLVESGPEARLNQTEFTQPALLAASVAVWRVWQQQNGKQPSLMAGHSLGEYSALVCAQALEFSDGIKLVAERGRVMQSAVPEGVGTMAAIVGLSDEQVQAVCEAAAQGQTLTPANYNAPGQVVVAGHSAAVERAIGLAKEAGAKLAKCIPVSVPSHCPLLEDAAKDFSQHLARVKITRPKLAVVNNVDVAIHEHPDDIRDALMRQLANPVQWVKTIQYFAQDGISHMVECGPGKVLAGLNKRIVSNIPTLSINHSLGLQEALATL